MYCTDELQDECRFLWLLLIETGRHFVKILRFIEWHVTKHGQVTYMYAYAKFRISINTSSIWYPIIYDYVAL